MPPKTRSQSGCRNDDGRFASCNNASNTPTTRSKTRRLDHGRPLDGSAFYDPLGFYYQLPQEARNIVNDNIQREFERGSQKNMQRMLLTKTVQNHPRFSVPVNGKASFESVARGRAKTTNSYIKRRSAPVRVYAANGTLEPTSVPYHDANFVNPFFSSGGTALHGASFHGHANVARALMNRGANVTAKNRFGEMPLHIASHSQHVNVARALLNKNAPVNGKDTHGQTPLFSIRGNPELAQLLMSHGANVKARNHTKSTPLHMAAMGSTGIRVADAMIERGALLTAKNSRGYTPLHDAIAWPEDQEIDMVRFLLDQGSRRGVNVVHAKNRSGKTPLHHAALMGHEDTTRALRAHGANASARNRSGKTPLNYARNHPQEMVRNPLMMALTENVNMIRHR